MRPAKIRGGIHCESMDSGQTIPVHTLVQPALDRYDARNATKTATVTIKTGVLPYSRVVVSTSITVTTIISHANTTQSLF